MKKIISFILGSIVALNLSISAANSAANEVRVAYFLEWPSPNLEDMQKKQEQQFDIQLTEDRDKFEKIKTKLEKDFGKDPWGKAMIKELFSW